MALHAGIMGRMRAFAKAAKAVSGGPKDLQRFIDTNKAELEARIAVETAKMRPRIKAMMMESLNASGLHQRSGTMQRAFTGMLVDISAKRILVHMPQGLVYPGKKKGNPYAAAGVFKYGGVRQPLTKSHYIDLPTGQVRQIQGGRRKGGEYGGSVRRAIKRVVLKGGHLTDREAKGRSGKALAAHAAGQITIIKPRPNFFQLTSAQWDEIGRMNVANVKRVLESFGFKVK